MEPQERSNTAARAPPSESVWPRDQFLTNFGTDVDDLFMNSGTAFDEPVILGLNDSHAFWLVFCSTSIWQRMLFQKGVLPLSYI